MDWKVLGIEPTKDKKEIKAAYRALLISVNPEDKPEEFKALRAAYEEALQLADLPDQEDQVGETGESEDEAYERDESPVGLWMEQVQALYNDFPARIKAENWKALFSEDVCIALDQRPLAEERLLQFLMGKFYVPQEVWQLMDETFAWTSRREELYEFYPRDFVDYAVMNGICYPDGLPYDLYEPGESAADCDQYRRLYYQAQNSAADEIPAILEQMADLPEQHPYGQAMCFQFEVECGRGPQGKAGLQKLVEDHPDDVTLNMAWAMQCAGDENWEQCEKLASHVLDLQPDHLQAKRMLADCLANTDRQEDAKELIFELMHAAGGDQKQLYYLNQVIKELNKTLMGRWEDKLAANPEDDEIAIELGWCYLQEDLDEKALGLCRNVNPDYKDPYSYHNLYAKASYACGEYEEAIVHFQALEQILENMEPDGTEKTAKRLCRLPELIQMEGGCLFELDRKAEGRAKFEKSLELSPENPEILTQMAHMLLLEKDYERAAEILTKLTEVMPGSYHGYYLLAMALYELYRDRDAFDAVNRALDMDGSDLGVYVLKMRILLRNGVWEEVRDILEFIEQSGITDDLGVMWCEAQLAEFDENEPEKALELYETIAKTMEESEPLPWASQLYFRMAVLLGEKRDIRREEDRAELMAILDKGLACDENDMNCLDYKAWILARGNRVEEAIAVYHKLEAMPRGSLDVEQELARLYYKDLAENADKALHYYQMLLDHEESDVLHFYVGYCKRCIGDLKGAEANFLREKELNPYDDDAYRLLSIIYEAMGRNEEALEHAEKVIELQKDLEGDRSKAYCRKIQILRRMGRVEEAIRTVDEVTEKCSYESAETMKLDIYCQFGLWDEARRHLEEWKKSRKKKNLLNGAWVKLNQLTGNYDEAREALMQGEKKFDSDDYQSLQLTMDEIDGNYEGIFRDWEARKGTGEHDDYALGNLAQASWWKGEYEQAREFAKKAKAIEDEYLEWYLVNETLYRSRRCLLLAILGREEEAKAELDRARSLPLCEGCDYGTCKDADIYEAYIEEIFGRYEYAMELYRTGMERWPDDTDFASGYLRLKKKGY